MSILLFSKTPSDPNAKTRLQSTGSLTKQEVAAVHSALVDDALLAVQLSDLSSPQVFWATEPTPLEFQRCQSVFPNLVHRVQSGTAFGERLYQAINESRSPGMDEVVVIGSDCPLLSPKILVQAYQAVKRGSLVVGPAQSGGFYLMGLPARVPLPHSFQDIFFERGELERLLTLFPELPVDLLPFLPDVDTAEDLESLVLTLKTLREVKQRPQSEAVWLPRAVTGLLLAENH